MALRLAGESLLAIRGADNQGWVREITAQDALPGLKIDQQGTGRVFDFQDGGASKMYLPDGGNVTVAGSLVFDLANDVTITPSNPAAPRTLTIPAVGGNRTFAFLEEAQTFTARPTLNAGLRLGDEAADPAAAGQFGLNGADAKVYSGGAVHNLSSIFPGLKLEGSQLTEGTTTSTTAVDIITVSGLSIPAATPLLIIFQARRSADAAAASQVGLKLNSTQVIDNANFSDASATLRAAGFVLFIIPRDDSNYLGSGRAGIMGLRSGANIPSNIITHGNNTLPGATITSVTVTGLSGNAAVTTAVTNLWVYSLPTS